MREQCEGAGKQRGRAKQREGDGEQPEGEQASNRESEGEEPGREGAKGANVFDFRYRHQAENGFRNRFSKKNNIVDI